MSSRQVNYLDFFKKVGKSKRLLRAGWVNRNVKDPESIAEHSFRVGVLAMVMSDKIVPHLDKDKLIKMALLHDLGELATGDIIVEKEEFIDIKKRDEKEVLEKEGIREIFELIGEGDKYASIFNEMITRSTPEAKFFWQLDKIEMALQALEYEEEQDKNIENIFLSVGLFYLKEPLIKKFFYQIVKSRKKEYRASLAKKLGGKN